MSLQIPAAHTLFSWLSGPDDAVPQGHTPFSWGCVSEYGGRQEQAQFESSSQVADDAAVKKGFLQKEAPPVKESIEDFLAKSEQRVFGRVLELHDRVCDEKTPFSAKYDAREILNTFLRQLEQCLTKVDKDQYTLEIDKARTRARFLLGVNFYDTEEVSQGETILNEVFPQLKTLSSKGSCHEELMDCLNHLGMIWSSRDEMQKAEGYLVEARAAHLEKVGKETLSAVAEKHFTTNLFLLAQVYQHLGKPELSAHFCQQTLDRQVMDGSCENDDWMKNATQLSGYFLSQDKLVSAAQCLAAAEVVRARSPSLSEETLGNLHWAWAKISLARLLAASEQASDSPLAPDQGLTFHLAGLETHLPPALREPLANYEQGCQEFKSFLSHIAEVKRVFPLDGACTEHVMALQDLSRAFRHLAALSGSPDDVCKMYKRRIDTLAPIAQQLNPAAFDVQCKELWYEVAEAYRDMFEIKVAQVEAGKKKIGQEKLQQLADGSIGAYRSFLRIFLPVPNDPETPDKNQPQGLGEAVVRRWYFTARFGLARILSKRPGVDTNDRRKFLTEALEEYRRLVELGGKMPFQPTDAVNFDQELQMCKEMVELLPAKIERLHTLPENRTGTA